MFCNAIAGVPIIYIKRNAAPHGRARTTHGNLHNVYIMYVCMYKQHHGHAQISCPGGVRGQPDLILAKDENQTLENVLTAKSRLFKYYRVPTIMFNRIILNDWMIVFNTATVIGFWKKNVVNNDFIICNKYSVCNNNTREANSVSDV